METVSPYLGARVVKGIRTGISNTGMAITKSRAAVARLLEQKFGYGLKRGLFRPSKPPVNLDAAINESERKLSLAVEEKSEGLTGFTDPKVHYRPPEEQKKPSVNW